MFESLYYPYPEEIKAFGKNWCGLDKYSHMHDSLVAVYHGDGDGQTAEVYGCAAPARFYTIKVLSGPNSIGKIQAAYRVGTGSGMAEFAAKLAEEISNGMIGFYPEGDAK